MQGRVARRLSKIESLSRDDAAADRLEANPKGRLSLRLMRRCSSSETLFIESPRRLALPEPQIQAAQTLRIEWERSRIPELTAADMNVPEKMNTPDDMPGAQ